LRRPSLKGNKGGTAEITPPSLVRMEEFFIDKKEREWRETGLISAYRWSGW
jgi:hypothetical protein